MLLPIQAPYVSGDVSVFEKLVSTGEVRAFVELPQQLHEFLVTCLLEHLTDVDVVHQTLALTFLGVQQESGSVVNFHLKQVGDGSLILDGLFPERASRLRVSSSYFRSMGQAAYTNLAARLMATGNRDPGRFYGTVAAGFAELTKVLRAARARQETSWTRNIIGC